MRLLRLESTVGAFPLVSATSSRALAPLLVTTTLGGVVGIRRTSQVLLSWLVFGCSESKPPVPPERPATIHAVFVVERAQILDSPFEQSATAYGGVMRMPSTVDAERVMRLSGFLEELPEVGTCEVVGATRPSPALSGVDELQMLDVGDITVQVGSQTTKLVRQAFPFVTGFLAGVVYSSRDREAEVLPPSSSFIFSAKGSGKVPRFSLAADSPPAIASVAVNAVGLQEVERVTLSEPIVFTWKVGTPDDMVWVELGRTGSQKTALCVFRDTEGRGTVPASLIDERGVGLISVHRLRQHRMKADGIADGRIQFDFRVTSRVLLD
jgi:hypothetical protein